MSTAVANVIQQISQSSTLKGVDLANITNASTATVSRWKKGKATPNTDTQLMLSDLRYVVDTLSEYYSPDEIRLWLYADNHLLAGKKAIDLIHNQQTDEVLDAIERLASHAFL
jgi:transcriptional regulator with XRE-family HTH domain